LSLAIGKKGQNVRLASKLIGWNIDIKSEEEKRVEIEAQMAALTAPGTALTELAGVGPKTIEKLESAGITSIEKLADMTPEQLVEIPGIGEKMVEKIHQSVAAYFEALETAATTGVSTAEDLNAGGAPDTGTVETEAALLDEATEEAESDVATSSEHEAAADPIPDQTAVAEEAALLDEATAESTEALREEEIGESVEGAEKP
jgi:N utilization substance protein A